jgi:S1-C subfamily serine protease
MKVLRLAILVLTIFAFKAWGQDAVPIEILERTFEIQASQTATGTAFAIDHNGKVYLVTARHVAAELPMGSSILHIRHSGDWQDLHVARKILPASPDVDIAVFEIDEKPTQPFSIREATGGVTFGQQVWFLGYPHGLRTQDQKGKSFPFIKKGVMSAIDSTNPDSVILYIDAFNNPGFSGGPILFWDFSTCLRNIRSCSRLQN